MSHQPVTRIPELQHRLLDLGYRSFQVNQIINEAAGHPSTGKLTPEEEQQVIQALEEFVRFAEKSKMLK